MKKLIALTIALVAFASVSMAQTTQTDNEMMVAYSFLRQDVKFERPNLTFNENTDSHGFVASYTRYVESKGKPSVIGFTAEVGANFDSKSSASLVTAIGGVTLKARRANYIQPYVKGLIGVARQDLNRTNLRDFDSTSFAYSVGSGLNFNLGKGSRYKLNVGADYIGTRVGDNTQHGVRLVTGLVF